MTDAVGFRQGVVSVMRGRGRDHALEHPHDGMQEGTSIERLIPAPSAVGAHDDRDLDDGVAHGDPAKAELHQHSHDPETRHQRVVERVVSIDHAHAHVGCRMMCAVQRPHHAAMRQTMPPVLRQISIAHQGQ